MRWLSSLLCLVLLAGCGSDPVRPGGNVGGGAGGNGGSGGAGGSGGWGGAGGSGGSGGSGGTGPTTPSGETYRAGSRIKVRYYKNADGALTLAGFRDTQLNQGCWFNTTSDGELRCVSLSLPYAHDSYFVDSFCQQPAAVESNCLAATPATEAVRYEQTSCPMRVRFFSLGAPLSTASIYVKNGASCLPSTLSAGSRVYPVGAELQPSRYVRGTRTLGTGTGIGVNTVTGDDGSSLSYGLRDVPNGTDCWPANAADNTTRCLPNESAYYGGHFADASCSNRAWVAGVSSCGVPKFLSREVAGNVSGSCAYTRALSRAGSTLSTYYSLSGTTCSAQSVGATLVAYAEGAAVPPSTFLAPTELALVSGRLTRKALAFPGGAEVYGPWYDTGFKETCSFWRVSDDSYRCVPQTGSIYLSAYYGDAACTVRIAYSSQPCASPKFALGWEGCPSRPRAWAVIGPHTGPVWAKSGTTCSSTTASTSFALYTLGAEVQPSAMVEATHQVQ